MEKDYCGDEPAYISGLGFRKKGERPITFSKSILDEEEGKNGEGYYIDKFGRKVYGTELKNLDISEISLVDRPCVSKWTVIKNLEGDDKEMNEEKELKSWENVSEKELSVIKETISILNKYDLVDDLKRAKETLTKYFEGEVKKYNDKVEWSQAQRAIFGYCEDDLAFISDEDIEIEKGSPNDKFPTLTRQFNRNQRQLEKAYEEYAVEERAI